MCVLYVWASLAEGVSGKQRHVTLDKGEMRGYDWLFSDVTDCEPSQLETIIRCLVTPSVSSPLLYPSFPFSVCLSVLHSNFIFLKLSLIVCFCGTFSACHSQANLLHFSTKFYRFLFTHHFFLFHLNFRICLSVLLSPLLCPCDPNEFPKHLR